MFVDAQGNIRERWTQWDSMLKRAHAAYINPYDPEKYVRVWTTSATRSSSSPTTARNCCRCWVRPEIWRHELLASTALALVLHARGRLSFSGSARHSYGLDAERLQQATNADFGVSSSLIENPHFDGGPFD